MLDLRSFLEDLEEAKDIIYIEEEVSTKFEIARILKEFDGGPAVFFKKVKESEAPVVGNVCGTRGRICKALGIRREELYARLIDALQNPTRPEIIEEAPVKEVIEKPKLTNIPILTHYEGDAGPYITSATVAARSPDGKIENVSIHRLLVLDDSHLVIRIVPYRHLHKLYEMAKEVGKPLEIAISIGIHPVVSLASTLSVPFGVSEYSIANALMNGEFRLTKCEHIGAHAPANAELVLEGLISLDREAPEGPLVDILGLHDMQRMQPVVEVVGVMRRESYIYQALLPGSAEHKLLMGLGREVNIWNEVRKVVPFVKAVNLTKGGCGWLHAVVSIRKQKEENGKEALKAIFSAHPSLKHAIVVDEDIDIFNPGEVEWAIATRFQGDEDLLIMKNVRGSTLDPSSKEGLTTKVGVNATRPLYKPAKIFEKAKIPESRHVKEVLKKIARVYFQNYR